VGVGVKKKVVGHRLGFETVTVWTKVVVVAAVVVEVVVLLAAMVMVVVVVVVVAAAVAAVHVYPSGWPTSCSAWRS